MLVAYAAQEKARVATLTETTAQTTATTTPTSILADDAIRRMALTTPTASAQHAIHSPLVRHSVAAHDMAVRWAAQWVARSVAHVAAPAWVAVACAWDADNLSVWELS